MNETITFESLPKAVNQLSERLENIEKLLLDKAEVLKSENPEQLLSVQEAANFLNLTVPTIYSKVSRNEIPFMKRSKRLYFSSTELMEYLKAGRRMSNAEIDSKAESYLKEKGGSHE